MNFLLVIRSKLNQPGVGRVGLDHTCLQQQQVPVPGDDTNIQVRIIRTTQQLGHETLHMDRNVCKAELIHIMLAFMNATAVSLSLELVGIAWVVQEKQH